MIKIIPTRFHGALDYLSVGGLLALPHALGWSKNVRRVLMASAFRILGYSALTRYELGLLRLLPMRLHLRFDKASGLSLAAAALFVGNKREKQALLGLGLWELAIALLSQEEAAVRSGSGPLAPVAERVGLLGEERAIHFEETLRVDRPVDELYRAWRNPEQLPQLLPHLKEVRRTGERTTHWTFEPAVGPALSWEAETVEEQPNERIAWRALPHAPIRHQGEVRFREAPGGGSELALSMRIEEPGGALGEATRRFFDEVTEQRLRDELQRFARAMERGELAAAPA